MSDVAIASVLARTPSAARADFPILATSRDGKPLAYLDSAATAQKPRAVLDAMDDYYRRTNANVHRGVYWLSEQATAAYEDARATVAAFIHASTPEEVIFTRNTTEAINLVAHSWGRRHVGRGDAILVSELEHHSNLVPWHLLAEERGARILAIPVDPAGNLDLSGLDDLLAQSVKLVAVTQMSNVLGTIPPIKEIITRAHAAGALVLVDGAQSVPHLPVDVQALACDFLAFSAHKMVGPTGIGALYGRRELLEAMPPFLGGGSMIRNVTLERSTYADVPQRFEAGTPAIAEAIGLGAAVAYLEAAGLPAVAAHERELLAYAVERLREVPELRLVGTPRERSGAISFLLGDVHPHDVGTVLDRHGVAVRAGHHCAQPLMHRLGVAATVRASVALYSTREDVDALVRALHAAREVFA